MPGTLFALLCGIGMLVFTASAAVAPRAPLVWLGTLLASTALCQPQWLGLTLAPLLVIEPAQLSLLVFLVVSCALAGKVNDRCFLVAGGVLACQWMLSLDRQGYPLLLAWLQVLLAAALVFLACRRWPGFCTPVQRHEAQLIVLVAALAMALVPTALSGWQTALGLQQEVSADQSSETAGLALLLVAAFSLLGALHALYRQQLFVRWKDR